MVIASRFVIVRRGHFATFELLTRTFADDPSMQIVWDRRLAERRRAEARPGHDERRNADRRHPPPAQWGQMNYMIGGDAGLGSSSA